MKQLSHKSINYLYIFIKLRFLGLFMIYSIFFIRNYCCRKKFSNRYPNQYCVNSWLWAKGCNEHLMLYRSRTWCLAPWVWNWPADLVVGRDSLASRTHSKTHPTLQAPGYSGTQHLFYNHPNKTFHTLIYWYTSNQMFESLII